MKKIFFITVSMFLLSGMARAETFKLTNGMVIEGEVTDSTDDTVTIKTADKTWRVERRRITGEKWGAKPLNKVSPEPSPADSKALSVPECYEKLGEITKQFQQKKDEMIKALTDAKFLGQKEPVYFEFFKTMDALKEKVRALPVPDDCRNLQGLTSRELQVWRDYVWIKFELDKVKDQAPAPAQDQPQDQSQPPVENPEETRLKKAVEEQVSVLRTLEWQRQVEQDRLVEKYSLSSKPDEKK